MTLLGKSLTSLVEIISSYRIHGNYFHLTLLNLYKKNTFLIAVVLLKLTFDRRFDTVFGTKWKHVFLFCAQ